MTNQTDLPRLSADDEYMITGCGVVYNRTPEFVEQVRRETRFVPLERAPQVASFAEAEAIGLRRIDCPFCGWKTTSTNGMGTIWIPHQGETTGLMILREILCRCELYKRYFSRWSGSIAMVPRGYQQFRLSILEPNTRSILTVTRQEEILAELRSNPDRSFLFFGPAGTGKSVFATALFAEALYNWARTTWSRGLMVEGVWRITAADQLQQEHDYAWRMSQKVADEDSGNMRPAKEPLVNCRKIIAARKAGLTPSIFLEEIDKTPRLTEARSSAMFALINTLYENDGNLFVTTNKTAPQLAEHLGSDNGEAILRRILRDNDTSRALLFDFHKPAC